VELAGPIREDRSEIEPATWKETTEAIQHPFGEFLSLFKGQGAAVRGDDRVVKPARRPPAAGV